MPKLLLAFDSNPFSTEQMNRLQTILPDEYEILCSRDEAILDANFNEITIIAGWVQPQWLARASKLAWLQQWGAGADWLMRHPAAIEQDFILTNVSGVHAVPISEHVFAMVLSLARNLPAAQRAANARVWGRLRQPGESMEKPHDIPASSLFELADATMLIVGVGAIGARTAKLAQAFGMNVIGVRRHPDWPVVHVNEMVGPEQLLAKIPEADVIVITLPYTKRTHNIIGEAEFAAMKHNCVLVNVGRGGTIDEVALLNSLREGLLKAAAMDVFAQEPLPAYSPFWEQENLLITPHYSGGTMRYHERAFAIFSDNLERWLRQQPLRNVVNKAEGY